jgi:hypothetical protein
LFCRNTYFASNAVVILIAKYIYKQVITTLNKMPQKPKLIKDMDDETWHEFTSICRRDRQKVSDRLTKLLREHMQKFK